jgi:hypothetical protein
MQEESTEESKKSIYNRFRDGVLPIRPTDSAPVKAVKQSAFFIFFVLVSLLTVVIVGAATLAL